MKVICKILFVLFFVGCTNRIEEHKFQGFEEQFRKHVSDADSILKGWDMLHPEIVYLKKGKPIGFEFRSSPEWGVRYELYFLNTRAEVIKTVIREDFYNHYKGSYDSMFVIEPNLNRVQIFTPNEESAIMGNEMIERFLIDPEECLNAIVRGRSGM